MKPELTTRVLAPPLHLTSMAERSCAVFCDGLCKVFPVFDAGLTWRVILGIATPNRGVKALDRVHLEVPKGEFVAVLGRNGAGKSTLLRTLCGVYEPDGGTCRTEGVLSGLFELGSGLGNVQLTGEEYAARWLEIYGTPRSRQKELLRDIAQFSELGEAFRQRILTYSTGMAARLYFATATAQRHDVLLVDELLSVGDEHFQAKCWSRIRDVVRTGVSGVLVTHDWAAAMRICSSGVVLHKGRIVRSGSIEKVVRDYLDLPAPTGRQAHFDPSVDRLYHADSGHDAVWEFTAVLLEDQPVEFGYSIETHEAGIGWEVLLLESRVPVGEVPGRYKLKLRIPKLPLCAGQYALNLFLTTSRSPTAAAQVLDARSWTYGNALQLEVRGVVEGRRPFISFDWELER